MLRLVKFLLTCVTVCFARELSDEELYRLPKLFHLDDYDRCLSQTDGVYCVGTFELTRKTKPNPAYEIITERLKQHFSFDRRLLHRGYCLNKRCQSQEENTTLRFEQCADRHINKLALTARLTKLSYCTTHAQRKAKQSQAPDLPQRLFLYVVYLILFLNILGTVYDVYGDGKKNKHILAWSMRANWKALTTVEDGASLFAPVQSSKIILHCLIIYTHAYLLHFMGYMHNPEVVEKSRDRFMNIIIRNGTSLVQVFILISGFFTGYNVLETARKSSFGAGLAAKWILKRMFRLAPVYLLLTAYSATWWPRNGDGPLWAPIVEAESQVCRNKFWSHVLFINNFVEPSELCMVQSWAIAAEIQLFLVSLLLTLLLMKLKVRAVPILGAMFAASCLFNVTLAYVAGLVPMVKVIVPETLRTEFRGSRSFFHLHTSPWSNLPACLFGLLVAHIYFEQKNKGKAKTEDRQETNGSIQNGLIQKNGEIVNENVVSVNEEAVRVKENGVCVNKNDIHVKENDVRFHENSLLANENCLCVKENCVRYNENAVLTNGNGICVRENGTPFQENGVCVNGNDDCINKNGVAVNGNGVYVNKNGVVVNRNEDCVNGNSVYINENGSGVNKNGECVNKNGLHVNRNGVYINENSVRVSENGHVNGIGYTHIEYVRDENGLRNRKYVADIIKSNGAKSTEACENKSNGVTNGVIKQNGSVCGNHNENKSDKNKKKSPFLLRYAHCFTFPALVVWVVLGSRVTDVDSAPAIALYVGLERLMFSLTFAWQLLQVITVKGPWAKLLSWRGWTVPARLVLSVAMVHWCVNATMLAARTQTVESSILYVSIDWLATLFYSYLVALPLSILVELPMKRAIDALI